MTRDEFLRAVAKELAFSDQVPYKLAPIEADAVDATLKVAADLLRHHENGWHPHELASVLESLILPPSQQSRSKHE